MPEKIRDGCVLCDGSCNPTLLEKEARVTYWEQHHAVLPREEIQAMLKNSTIASRMYFDAIDACII